MQKSPGNYSAFNLYCGAGKSADDGFEKVWSFTTSFPSVDFLFALHCYHTQEREKRKRWDPIENDLINEDEVDKF